MKHIAKTLFVALFATLFSAPTFAQGTQTAAGYQVYGFDALRDFGNLHLLRAPYLTMMNSSHERDGGNLDGAIGSLENFRYVDGAERVMTELKGPGVLTRLWLTGYGASDRLKFYFDGETTPTIDKSISQFFSGTSAPLYSPLSVNDAVSSGGFICYVPMTFNEGVKVTTTGNSYYNIQYEKHFAGEEISTFDPATDYADVRALWQNKGEDPKDTTNYTTVSIDTAFNSGDSIEIFSTASAGKIGQIVIDLNELTVAPPPATVTDDGRATTGYSAFDMVVDSTASEVKLVRRFDYGIGNQKAEVFVDGVSAGEWFSPGNDAVDNWRNAEFIIDSALVAHDDTVRIKVQFMSGDLDWNEFYYWMICDDDTTDELDVRNGSSETAHNYVMNPMIWHGERTFSYPADNPELEKNSDILLNVRIKMYWDGETEPSVDAPVGLFFGGGTLDGTTYASLPTGFKEGGELYCYFPMPFESSARIDVINNSSHDLPDFWATVKSEPLTENFEDVGYFKTMYRDSFSTTPGEDLLLLDVEGRGHFMGVVQEAYDDDAWYLEGDERFYLDDSKTPWLYGTGTEDYYNCGWYFNQGEVGLATHGMPNQYKESRTMYRWHFPDPISFRKNGKFYIEHGGENDAPDATYRILSFYYLQSESDLRLSDELDVSDAASRTAHNYTGSGFNAASLTSAYEGVEDDVEFTDDGYEVSGYTEFDVSIYPNNDGVYLLRTFDYSMLNQGAEVYVNDSLLGEWYSAGENDIFSWRDEAFLLPPSITDGESTLHIKMKAGDGGETPTWTEYAYKVYTITDDTSGVNVERRGAVPDAFELRQNYPNPFNPTTTISYTLPEAANVTLTIYDALGGKVRSLVDSRLEAGVHEARWNGVNEDGVKCAGGVYVYRLEADDFSASRKLVLLK
ncbi:MAG: DUF2961 domain-containing protein [Ignavibacteriales bacterium]|nr:DUF2961 domain-containing protein [Ignavibacteriales bacterium]